MFSYFYNHYNEFNILGLIQAFTNNWKLNNKYNKGLVPNKKTIHNSIYYMPINQTYYSQVKTNTRSHPSPEDTNGLKTWEFSLELNVGPREREQWLLPIGVFSCRKTKN